MPRLPEPQRPSRVARLLAAIVAFAVGIVCLGTTVIAWSDAHVTYALPGNNEGHDVLAGGLLAAFVAGVATVVSVAVGILVVTGRWRRPTAAFVVGAGCLVVSVVALVLFQSAPHPTY